MRSQALVNLLSCVARITDARAVVMRLRDDRGSPAIDLVEGDPSLATRLQREFLDTTPDRAADEVVRLPLFNLPDCLTVRLRPDTCLLTIEVTDQLFEAAADRSARGNRRAQKPRRIGTLLIGACIDSPERPWRDVARWFASDHETASVLLGTAVQAIWELYQGPATRNDPVTGLIRSADLLGHLGTTMQAASVGDETVALFLINPDDFAQLNRRVGRNRADEVLREIAVGVTQSVRQNDSVYRYGGATIAVVARLSEPAHAETVVAKLRGALESIVPGDGAERISFSIGYATTADAEAGIADTTRLCLCADVALSQAKARGGGQTVVFRGAFDRDAASAADPVSSIFTSDTVKDFRNGRILWNTIRLVSTQSRLGDLAATFVAMLRENFALGEVTLVRFDDGRIESFDPAGEAPVLSEAQRALVEGTCERRASQWQRAEVSADTFIERFSAPLLSHDRLLGCLYVEGDVRLDASEQVFLRALADQLAGAIDRVQLAERWLQRTQSESRRLRREIAELRGTPQATGMVAESSAMQALLELVQKIAPTDASVLVLGESGTGKEVLARTIHQLSSRQDKPLITVDCSAIAQSLIDSELFGRTKGAFTGADAASHGRIAQAHGGTLFLDEIGELPLEVQAKLLRFVQEKEVTAVGSTQSRRVDARIVCATNRNLLDEVREGRFRKDLYYRLQVVQLAIPPLRERVPDLRELTEQFLAEFAARFGKPNLSLTHRAWEKLEAYVWPGNVRELQNCVMRAVITADQDSIDSHHLELGEELPAPRTDSPPQRMDAPQPQPRAHVHGDPDADRPWAAFQRQLPELIRSARADAQGIAPLGRWLMDDLVRHAAEREGGNTRRAAAALELPETTFRRRWSRVQRDAALGANQRNDTWHGMTRVFDALVAMACRGEVAEPGLFERSRLALLAAVAEAVGADTKTGALIVGVSQPTYLRWQNARVRQPRASVSGRKPAQVRPAQSAAERGVRP